MHKDFMMEALKEAYKAYEKGEVPVGAVIVKDGRIISKAHNLRESLRDATAHAEVLAIREACKRLNSWRLADCNLYVTLEPCPMCAGAILQARIARLVFGAMDFKAGCAGSIYNFFAAGQFNHSTDVISGIMEDECRDIMKKFFGQRR
jgi:tRNA(adenine34) deaminase